MKFFRRRLFWKFFFSYFVLVLLSMVVLGVVMRILLPGLFNNQLVRMTVLFSQHGFETSEQMMSQMGGMMMGESGLFENLFSIFNQIILDAVLYAVLPSILVALAVSAVMSQHFVQPLQQMTRVADRIAEGNYEERLPIPKTASEARDELEWLAVRFNRMIMQLEQNDQLRQKLIGDVAHELRTPLTVIKGSMEGLVDGVLKSDASTYEMLYRQADRLDRLVNDLQELSQIESGILDLKQKPLNINEFLAQLTQMMKISFLKKDIELIFQKNEARLIGVADKDRLEQVMINLLSNALRYTPEGGRVWVTAGTESGMVKITVRDTGIGIPEEHLPLIFSRFYRVDDSRSREDGGSGIGLTIAKKLVEAQGGQIWAESGGLDAGAAFHFTLPHQ